MWTLEIELSVTLLWRYCSSSCSLKSIFLRAVMLRHLLIHVKLFCTSPLKGTVQYDDQPSRKLSRYLCFMTTLSDQVSKHWNLYLQQYLLNNVYHTPTYLSKHNQVSRTPPTKPYHKSLSQTTSSPQHIPSTTPSANLQSNQSSLCAKVNQV